MGEPLDRQFTAKLQKSENKGGWTYVVMRDSAAPQKTSQTTGAS